MRRAFAIAPVLLALGALAQQDGFRSKLSVQGGLVRSLGDITTGLETFDPGRTAMLGLSYERFMGYGVSLYGGYEHVRLSGNDRETGDLDRSLNFLAKVNTVQLGLRFHADNGRLLNYDARFAPFVQVGFGVGAYDVFGDLYDREGNRYHYWGDGTIRTAPEGGPDAVGAQVTMQDGVFETRLTDLATEEGKPRDAWFAFVPARIGMKWRISERFSAELAYAFNWTFTDHLDDVSGDYPASFATEELAYISNPAGHTGTRGGNGQNDHYHHLSLGLSMGIGRRAHRYRMPPIRTLAPASGEKERAVAPPDTMPPTTTAPEVPDSLPANRWTIHVESIRIARLEVDTLVVRGQAVPDTAVTPKSTPAPDTTVRKVLEPMKVREQRGDTTLVLPKDTPTKKSTVDTLRRDAPADTLRRKSPEQAPDAVVVPKSTIVEPAAEGATAVPDTSKQRPADKETPQPDEPKSTRTEGGTTERVTTERIIERTAPPVVLVQKEVVRDTVVKHVLVPDTVPMKADTTAAAPKDGVAKAAPPVPAEPAPHVRSALETRRDHAIQMNRMHNDRILTLERYLAVQEESGGTAELDSLRQRIAVLDKQLAAKRAEAPERVDDPEERTALTDSVRFASESSEVRANYRESLEATARRLIDDGVKKVLVTGHTDRAGDAQYNLELSQRRAEAVAEVLRAAGVPAERIKVKGLGRQLASERHDRNERVVVVQAVPEE